MSPPRRVTIPGAAHSTCQSWHSTPLLPSTTERTPMGTRRRSTLTSLTATTSSRAWRHHPALLRSAAGNRRQYLIRTLLGLRGALSVTVPVARWTHAVATRALVV